MDQRSLLNAKKKTSLPVLRERQTLADSLARILSQLGLERRQAPPKSLNEYLAEKTARRSTQGLQAALGADPAYQADEEHS